MTIKVVLAMPDIGVENMFLNSQRDYKIVREAKDADLCVFTGGADISPKLYREPKIKQTHVLEQRDRLDLGYVAMFKDRPKVGICRGGQLLNVVSGGAMYQHVDNHTSAHKVKDIFFTKSDLKVSSTHHQMMIPGKGAEILAFSEGLATQYLSGTARDKPRVEPEVVWYEDTMSLCFQPHPELSGYPECRDYFFDLLDYFYQ